MKGDALRCLTLFEVGICKGENGQREQDIRGTHFGNWFFWRIFKMTIPVVSLNVSAGDMRGS